MNKNTVSNDIKLVSKYWKKKILNREEVLGEQQKQNSLSCITINANELNYFDSLTNKNPIAQYTVISAIYSFLLKKLINEFDGYVVSDFKDQNSSLLLSYPIDLKTSFKEYLHKIKLEILETLKHSDYNNYHISEEIGLNDLSVLSNYNISINSDTRGIDCNGLLFNVKINEVGDMEICTSYLENFVKKAIVELIVLHFKNFIVSLENNITFNLSEYPLLSEKEKHQLLVDFNATDVAYPKDKTIVDLFEEQVEKTPYNIAVVFEESKLTYKELNEKANQLANYISCKHTVKNGDIIGVFLPKSDIGIISLLTILKLGAVYLPIDTNYPQERIDYLIKDSGLNLLITDSGALNVDNCDTVAINTINFEDNSKDNINRAISSKDLAYIIYTSGSTGQPKGVMVEHTSNINMSLDQIGTFEITESDKVVWFASVAFDASISEIMMSLYSGATLCIPTEETVKDKDQFINFIKETKSTVVTFAPSYLGLLSEKDISGLRCVITAGESANPIRAIAIVESGIDYYNAYGPTECAVCVSIYKVAKDDFDKSIISIGSPISNTQVYILDESLEVLPIGVIGKLYVSGAGLSRGYLNRPDLTAEKFISNPFKLGAKMYDTGDLARWLPDGNIEFLGRKDFQVKIRGYRIELGEIEVTISQFNKHIRQIVVDAREVNGEKALIAYYTTDEPELIDKTILREYLQSKLPDYMVPGFLVELESIPLTPNGKIDRKALPDVTGEDLIRRGFLAPRNEIEHKLTVIFQEVLGIDNVGITDNFFELGGHSLMVAQVLNKTHQKLAMQISFKDFFAYPTIEGIAENLSRKDYVPIPKATEQQSYPLTPSQQRLWILSQLEGGSQAYNMPSVVRLKGKLNIEYFERAFGLFIDRHEITRTLFKTDKVLGEIRQYVTPKEEVSFKIQVLDFTQKDQSDVEDYLQAANSEVFNLEQSPLIRASLLKKADQEFLFFLSMHHIIGDGWSTEVLISEVVGNYNTLLRRESNLGGEEKLASLSIQYKDYAVWLQQEIKGEKYQKAEAYWLEQFKGDLPVIELPSYKTRPLIQTYNGDNLKHIFSKEFTEKLTKYSDKHGVTLFMTLMTGINALLYRYTGQHDIIVGTPIAGREHPDLENQIGLYLNTLAIRTRFEESNNAFESILHKEKDTLLSAYENQMYPFDELVSKLNIKRNTSHSALFDVLVVFQNQSQLQFSNREKDIVGLQIEGYDYHRKTSQFDISYIFVEENGQLGLTIEYNTDIYDAVLIGRMFSHFENLLTQVIENETRNHKDADKQNITNLFIEDIDFLTKQERHQLLVEFNDTEADYPRDQTIIELFEQQVEKNLNKAAVFFEGKELTYRDLNEQANQLGDYLRQHYNIQPDDLIAIKLERSEKMIVVILGILKSGAAYVPIDPNYPQDRIDYIEEDTKAKVTIDEDFLKTFAGQNESNTYLKENLSTISKPDSLVYVIYTSGTTGQPKGVMIENKNVTRLLINKKNLFHFDETDVWTMFHSYFFDFSVWEMYGSLLYGGKLVVVSNKIAKDTPLFAELLESHKVSVLNQTPSAFYNLAEEGLKNNRNFKLKYIIFGGEALQPSRLKDWILRYPQSKLINMYGITETTVHVTYKNITLKEINEKVGNIGKAIPTLSCYVLDDNKQLAPIGSKGEIYVGGEGVARGYLNKPELTMEKFIKNPYVVGDYLYRSGDLARVLETGDLEYLGRRDFQVKIRGYRIELGDIETNISQFSNEVKQVIVEAKMVNQEKILVAYYVTDKEKAIDKRKLREYLQTKLPDYMVPSFFVEIESIPLTSNGKINRKALPSVVGEDLIRREYVEPRNETEQKLVDIWQELLEIDKVGITDNFFELGGHSLVAIKVIHCINENLNINININQFFKHNTIKDLADLINNLDLIHNLSTNNYEESESEKFTI